MTDEEKAEEIINNFLRKRKFYFSDLDMARDLIKIALEAGRKELKKENAELKEKVADLTAEREYHLTLMEGLNARIEKMKICFNCAKQFWSDGDCLKGDKYLFYCADCKCDKWEPAK